ncbi:glycosyltransferase domain-containing protein [Eubacterium xylanophilum]|uniref:glycosyltransferase domain-containing protein n=1 Tax=Eubacterium xylanophilum TaxID=39497 RepID=UPI00047BF425|nr:glycosyltransferase domain-containing protein [Eubacterium xylanophilum]
MDEKNYLDNLLYLNNERIKTVSSREYFCGKKFVKYYNLFKKIRIINVIRELGHDTYAFFKKDNSDRKLIDLENGRITNICKKIVVYTCIYGNYDRILEPLFVDPNCDYYIFTDQPLDKGSIWKKVDDSVIPKECTTPELKNRYVKMFPEKFFSCDYSIYIDGNLQVVGATSVLVQKELLKCRTGISMHLSPRENCIYDEAYSVCHLGKISKKERNKVLSFYKKNKMPKKFGMFECNVIVRDHKNANVEIIMDSWWENYRDGIKRDQLYFTYVLYSLGYNFGDVVSFGASVNHNPIFLRKEHM